MRWAENHDGFFLRKRTRRRRRLFPKFPDLRPKFPVPSLIFSCSDFRPAGEFLPRIVHVTRFRDAILRGKDWQNSQYFSLLAGSLGAWPPEGER